MCMTYCRITNYASSIIRRHFLFQSRKTTINLSEVDEYNWLSQEEDADLTARIEGGGRFIITSTLCDWSVIFERPDNRADHRLQLTVQGSGSETMRAGDCGECSGWSACLWRATRNQFCLFIISIIKNQSLHVFVVPFWLCKILLMWTL